MSLERCRDPTVLHHGPLEGIPLFCSQEPNHAGAHSMISGGRTDGVEWLMRVEWSHAPTPVKSMDYYHVK